MMLVLKNGSPNPELLPEDQISNLRLTFFGTAVYGWIFFTVTLFMIKPVRNRRWWLGAFINICVGISTCCLAPFCIPLAIKWNSPDVRDYFNRQSFEL
jgi:hypothetical protein